MTVRPPRLRVVVTDGCGRRIPPQGLAGWLSGVAPASAKGEVTVALVGDQHMRSLNRRFRGLDRVTDVLSFPMDGAAHDPQLPAPTPRPKTPAPRYVGDIVIAIRVALRQARLAGHSLTTELRVLALHGLLHLLGYDHGRNTRHMERIEQRLRRKGGLPHTLIQRSRRAAHSRVAHALGASRPGSVRKRGEWS